MTTPNPLPTVQIEPVAQTPLPESAVACQNCSHFRPLAVAHNILGHCRESGPTPLVREYRNVSGTDENGNIITGLVATGIDGYFAPVRYDLDCGKFSRKIPQIGAIPQFPGATDLIMGRA